MSASALTTSLNPATPAEDIAVRAELSEIDASARAPAIFFLGSAVLWLLVGTLYALIASIKLHQPHFLGNIEWLSFGHARTVHLNTVIYGWATNAAIAVSFWLMARLSRSTIRHSGLLFIAGAFWNIGVTIGVIGIMRGDSNAIEWLEMPSYATPLLFVAYALIGAWAIITFRFGKSRHIYVSQWYILAALFWFPWLYSIAQIMLVFSPARGTVQSLVNWWFAHNVLGLWFTPIGLGSVYYFLPKVLGKPIHSYYLSILGFWSLALFYNWAGVHHLIGGPVPVWVQSCGIVASLMMTVPVIVTGINHHMTMVGSFGKLKSSPTLRFIVFGAVNYTLVSLQGSAMSLRSWAEITHFTQFTIAHAHWGMYAFFTMVMFGAIYYIMPRLVLKEWPSAKLISIHFWATAIGILAYVIGLSWGGILQGILTNAPKLAESLGMQEGTDPVAFIETVKVTLPWLEFRTYSGILITIGHIAFAVNFVWILLRKRPAGSTAPTLFTSGSEMEVTAR
ncbi:Cbb3-type cytochrome oxidase, subunit 1 [Opitutaceae bacterium TAV1]|nr:membrane protein [Opitutaceae bacterium TAV5]EIQ00693.1 Cbb3-type cytochrome oxidase, subunit 1 [Opitutaceae bacterium TAV1]